MREVVTTGRTIEEATTAALEALGVSAGSAEIEILDEGNKGIFGILGNKLAKVKATVRESEGAVQAAGESVRLEATQAITASGDRIERAREFLEQLLAKLDVQAEVEERRGADTVALSVTGAQLGLLIGRRGQTLDALQYLVNLVANRGAETPVRFVVDVEGYRERREETLRHLAARLAAKVKGRRHRAVLEPMTPQERRIIHLALQDDAEVYTYSEGVEPFRRVVIALKDGKEREGSGGGFSSR